MSDDKKDLNALWDLVCSTKTDGHDQYDLVAHHLQIVEIRHTLS